MSPPYVHLRVLLTGASMAANGSSQTSHSGVPRHKQQGLEAIMGEQGRPPLFNSTQESVAQCRSTREVAFDGSLVLMSTGSRKFGPTLAESSPLSS